MARSLLARVPAGVLVGGGVAAHDEAVGHAHPQVDPGISLIKTCLATGRLRLDVKNLIKMRALARLLSTYPLERKADVLQQSHKRRLLSRSAFLPNSLLRALRLVHAGPAG